MRLRSNADDPRRSQSLETVDQQISEQEQRKVVDRKSQLEPVEQRPVFWRHQPGVIDQPIQPTMSGKDFVGEATHLGKPGKKSASATTTLSEPERSVTTECRLSPGTVATGHNDPHPGPGEAQRL
jgi:hypothetical protein